MITTSVASTKTESMDLNEQLNNFFIQHEKKAFVIANMSLKNQDDALDVVQDVMIKFVEKYKHKDMTLWPALFYRMIQNRITDFHRTHTKRKGIFRLFRNEENENIIDQELENNDISALQKLDFDVQIENLQDSLKTLPTRQFQAFTCRIWEGLSVAETARSMKCSQGSVKTHLYRALEHIRAHIEYNEV